MLVDISLYDWLHLSQLRSNYPNLVDQPLPEFVTPYRCEELKLGFRDQILQRLFYRILYDPALFKHTPLLLEKPTTRKSSVSESRVGKPAFATVLKKDWVSLSPSGQ